jgi:hypothetical protein
VKKIPPAFQILSVWLLVVILGSALTMSRASADVDDGDLVLTPQIGGSAKISDSGMTTNAVADCPSGYFCIWPETSYRGGMRKFSQQSQYLDIPLYTVRSFYNNRSGRVFVYGDPSGSPSACYGPGVRKSTTSGWLQLAEGTYLSTATSC